MQTRTLLCFKDGSGYTIGSTEGRVAIQYIDDSQARQFSRSPSCSPVL